MDGSPDKMTEEEYQEALADYLKDHPLPAKTAQSNTAPKAIILAGQPGAGKSVLTKNAKRELETEGRSPVVIDPDECRPYHSRHLQHRENDPYTCADVTHHDASRMSKDLRRMAMENRNDIILDGTFADREKALHVCKELTRHGYEIDIRAMAVSQEVSRRNVYARFEKGLEAERTDARFVPDEVQDRAYEGLPDALQAVEDRGLANSLSLHDEAGQAVYTSQHDPDQKLETVSGAMYQERNREMSHAKLKEIERSWKDLNRPTHRYADLEPEWYAEAKKNHLANKLERENSNTLTF